MILTKIFPSDIHALHLEVPIEEFIFEWKACIADKKRDLSRIIEILEPYLQHWKNLLTDEYYEKDVQYATLYQRLTETDGFSYDLISLWIESTDLDRELRYIALEVLRNSNQYYPKAARPKMVEYVFAYPYRAYLRKYIKAQLRAECIAFVDDETILAREATEQGQPDVFIIKSAGSNRWEEYLFYLISNGFTTMEIAEVVRLPRETFYYEEREVWEQIKILWQQPAE